MNRVYQELKQKYPQGGTSGAVGVAGGPGSVVNGMSVKPGVGPGSNLHANNNNGGGGGPSPASGGQ